MTKNERKEMIDFLEDIFDNSNILNYKYVDIDGDNDVNFFVIPKINNKKLKQDIQIQLLIYCSDDGSLSFYCPLMFKLEDKDSLMFVLSVINDVNNKIAVGKVYLNKDNNSIVSYIYRALFNNIYNELTPDLVNDYIDAFLLTSYEFYSQIKGIIHEDEQKS